ncbi:type II secretion system GspH family protein [Shewanella sp. AS16]|uniref:type IV pilus modification PilV family protein n=1 Tax=Shewanella sp. AS16 TaxID=2907625 RepID=UPI001F444A34|nr:type II secretion system protein [Shewanella sp. AS16]MCE9685913.1 type II secretion system GspH family protein [Shewanella sp. AS16]
MPTSPARFRSSVRLKGFTLIELVVGMLVIAIAMVLLTGVLFPQADRAAGTLHRMRSAELAHAILNEIWGKRYDENTASGGVPACDSPVGAACTQATDFGPEAGEGRNDFDDVDDYNDLDETAKMLNSSQTYADAYPNYRLSVVVALGAVADTKLVTVDVTTPNGEVITYHAVRSNY